MVPIYLFLLSIVSLLFTCVLITIWTRKKRDLGFLLLCSPRHLSLVPTYSLVQWEIQSVRSSCLQNYIFYLVCSPRHLSLVPTYLQWKNQSECSSEVLRNY